MESLVTVAQLIEELKKAPQERMVSAWDGDYQHPIPVIAIHIDEDCVWLESSVRG